MLVPDPRIARRARRAAWWNLLLLLPFIALLWPPFYNRIEPTFFGVPFFYWYQFLWVFLTSLLIYIVDVRTRDRDIDAAPHRSERP